MYVHLLALHFKVPRRPKKASLAVFPEPVITSLLDHTNWDQFTYVSEHGERPVARRWAECSEYAVILTSLATSRVLRNRSSATACQAPKGNLIAVPV